MAHRAAHTDLAAGEEGSLPKAAPSCPKAREEVRAEVESAVDRDPSWSIAAQGAQSHLGADKPVGGRRSAWEPRLRHWFGRFSEAAALP